MPDRHLQHSYYKYYAFVRPEQLKRDWSRNRILSTLDKEGVPGLSGSCPEIYREAAFGDGDHERLPIAQEMGETSIMFNVHPTLTPADIEHTINVVREVCLSASK